MINKWKIRENSNSKERVALKHFLFYVARNPSKKGILPHYLALFWTLVFLQHIGKAEHSENQVSKEVVSIFAPCYNISPRFTSMISYNYMIYWYDCPL